MQGNLADALNDLTRCENELRDIANGHVPLEDGLARLMAVVCQRVGHRTAIGSITLYWPDNRLTSSAWTASDFSARPKIEIEEPGLTRIAHREGQVKVVGHLKRDHIEDYVAFPAEIQRRIRSEIAVPIFVDHHILGVIDIASQDRDAFDDDERTWLAHVAGLPQFALLQPPANVAPQRDVRLQHEDETAAEINHVLDEILEQALQVIGTGSAHASILVLDGELLEVQRELRTRSGKDSAEPQAKVVSWSSLPPEATLALRRGERTFFSNKQPNDKATRPATMSSHAMIAIKRSPTHQVIGAIYLVVDGLGHFSKDQADALTALAERGSLAIYAAQLMSSLRHEQDRLEELAGLVPPPQHQFDPHHVRDLILEATFHLLPQTGRCAMYTVVHAEQRVMRDHLLNAPEAWQLGSHRDGRCKPPLAHYPLYESILEDAIHADEIIARAGLESGAHPELDPTTRAVIVIPLVERGIVTSALVAETADGRGYTPHELSVAKLLKSQASAALESIHDYSRTLMVLRPVLEETHQVILKAANPEELVDTILSGAMRVANALDGYSALILLDEDDKLRILHEYGDDLLEGRRMEWSKREGLAGKAVRLKTTVYVPDVDADPDFIRATARGRSNLVVPLIDHDGEAVGALSLESPKRNTFDEHVRNALEQFAAPVVTALIEHGLVLPLQERQHAHAKASARARDRLDALRAALTRDAQRKEMTPTSDIEIDFIDLMLDLVVAYAESLGVATPRRHELVDIGALVSKVVRVFRYHMNLDEDRLVEIPPVGEAFADVNRVAVEEALWELLTNAVTYTTGRITVRVSRILHDIQIVVEDEGQGVGPAEREHLFESGWRGSNAEGIAGEGVGLYFARKAMDREGGDAFVEARVRVSGEGNSRGSRFILRLPEARAA